MVGAGHARLDARIGSWPDPDGEEKNSGCGKQAGEKPRGSIQQFIHEKSLLRFTNISRTR
jgi:hypothetical protein